MADVSLLDSIIRQHFPYNAGAFYGSAHSLSVGAGVIYDGIRVPEYNIYNAKFDTYERPVFVLTHECDIDHNNDRNFNESVLVCPIIPINILAEEFEERTDLGAFFGMLPDIAADKVYRVFMLPPGMPGCLTQGAILELNTISSTHVTEFRKDRAIPLCALSQYAQGILDRKIENHLLRPKSEILPILS